MSGFEVSRRGFLMGCSSAVAAMAGARFNSIVFGSPEDEPNQEIMLVVFLRGGMDALNFMPVIGGADRAHYEAARSDLRIPVASALQLGTTQFGLHPAAAPLHDLYQAGNLAIVQAAGMHEDTRSHFDAMKYMELGTPGVSGTSTGWITRHLESAANLPDEIMVPAMSVGYYAAQSTLGSNEVLSMYSPDVFHFETGPWWWRDAQRTAMREMYMRDTTMMHGSGLTALNAVDIVEANLTGSYTPLPGVSYPDTEFGNHLQVVAQMIKQQLGLRVATVDLGGWDTHESQGDGVATDGYFYGLVSELSSGLAALFADLNTSQRNFNDRVTVVVMSEFGRRLEENADGGTDHGHAGVMMVLGGAVNGGLHGTWPGLDQGALFEGIDLDVTTDYRQVLSEILIRRLGNPHLGAVFPGYESYNPLGVVQGVDLPPNFGRTPTAIDLRSLQSQKTPAGKVATAAGIGLAATAGLVALRERGRHTP